MIGVDFKFIKLRFSESDVFVPLATASKTSFADANLSDGLFSKHFKVIFESHVGIIGLMSLGSGAGVLSCANSVE